MHSATEESVHRLAEPLASQIPTGLFDRLAAVVDHLIADVERDGTNSSNIAVRVAGPNADALEVYVVDDAVRELIAEGAIKYQRKRGQSARIRVAPWVN